MKIFLIVCLILLPSIVFAWTPFEKSVSYERKIKIGNTWFTSKEDDLVAGPDGSTYSINLQKPVKAYKYIEIIPTSERIEIQKGKKPNRKERVVIVKHVGCRQN